MVPQDVTDTSPVTAGEYGLRSFLVAPQIRNTSTPRHAPATDTTENGLMFFMTRSYQTLTYSDGGD